MNPTIPFLPLALVALAGLSTPAPAAETIGRLFFTPVQRSSLDVARGQRARTTLATEATEQVAAPVSQTITYGGMLRRSDGATTVWLNNQAVRDREPASGATVVNNVRADGSVSLIAPQSGRNVRLKPGQSVELLSGTIEEGYARRLTAPEPELKPAAKPSVPAQTAKPESPESRRAEREREERETRRVEEAISRALVETASARPGAAPGPEPSVKQ